MLFTNSLRWRYNYDLHVGYRIVPQTNLVPDTEELIVIVSYIYMVSGGLNQEMVQYGMHFSLLLTGLGSSLSKHPVLTLVIRKDYRNWACVERMGPH